jgi:predicted RNA-binding protein with PIN domain
MGIKEISDTSPKGQVLKTALNKTLKKVCLSQEYMRRSAEFFLKDSPMRIIIDGYNMIRQSDSLRRYERFSLEAGRNALIQKAALYKKRKGHRVTIVFDGWENGPAAEERDRQEGIDIIYSRRGEKADDVIKQMVEKREEEMVIVTSDRDIATYVRHRGGTTVSSQEFETLTDRAVTVMPGLYHGTGPDSKDHNEEIRNERKKKGPSRRLSRKEKAAITAFRKL